ncbi:MAG: DUF1015 family protein [Kofleriaceae bacterium]
MPQIAGFRGILWDTSKVELAKVAAQPITEPRKRLESGELVRDPTRAVYRYHQAFAAGTRTLVRKSWFAAIALSPWSEGTVRPHEATDPKARERAIAGVAAAGIHTDAVLAGYRDAAGEVDRLFKKSESERPLAEVTTADGTNHRLWRVQSAEVIGKLRPLFAPKKLHVLDGHARYEGMLAYRDQLAAKAPLSTYSSANYGLACLVNLDEPTLAAGARHRVVRGTAKRDDVLAKAKAYFIIEKLAGAAKDLGKQFAALADTVAHQPAFVAVFPNDPDAYKLTLSPDISPIAEGVSVHRAIQKYDPVIVDALFLAKAAPGATIETVLDPNAAIALGEGVEMAIVCRPLSLAQITHVDEVSELLPFGSTAIHPPVARLVAFLIDADEDVI